ncbi:hypothetical protein F2Q68_00045929 [Brassica cretica]|uniref:Uncharacterized protein n=1 Tax=Brassica cretica TaxID=69181 RepID=A0A8S9LNV7_BRACR|nr:hypothetical protein F2Q68_00045929 [Brassica cretica]
MITDCIDQKDYRILFSFLASSRANIPCAARNGMARSSAIILLEASPSTPTSQGQNDITPLPTLDGPFSSTDTRQEGELQPTYHYPPQRN